jgi:hypothetical protein
MPTLTAARRSTATPAPRAGPPAERLRATMTAVRLSFTWFGVRKALTPQQTARAADPFGAEGKFLSAGKKLLDTSHPAFQEVTTVKGKLLRYWRGISLPYPEPGLRLIRRSDLEDFQSRLREFQEELAQAVLALDEAYDTLRANARQRLGGLFNAADYPVRLTGLFTFENDFPSVEPPSYLRQLDPELYAQECQRMRARFEEAVQLAEQAFTSEFQGLITHLCERLSGETEGSPKVFRNSAVTHLTEFFERFRTLSIGSDAELERLVNEAQGIVRGVTPQSLRTEPPLRDQVARQLAGVQSRLEGLLVDRPRRNIQRSPRAEGA